MTVHVIILVFALSVYGFAPYGFDQLTQRSLVQQSNLAVEVVERTIIRNIWGGPPQVISYIINNVHYYYEKKHHSLPVNYNIGT